MKLFAGGIGIGSGLVIGLASAALSPTVLPIVTKVGRKTVRAAVKGGMLLYEKGKLLVEEARQGLADLAAEARSELKGKKPKGKSRTAKTIR